MHAPHSHEHFMDFMFQFHVLMQRPFRAVRFRAGGNTANIMPGDLSSSPPISLLDLAASLVGFVALALPLWFRLSVLYLQQGLELSDLGGGLCDLHRKWWTSLVSCRQSTCILQA